MSGPRAADIRFRANMRLLFCFGFAEAMLFVMMSERTREEARALGSDSSICVATAGESFMDIGRLYRCWSLHRGHCGWKLLHFILFFQEEYTEYVIVPNSPFDHHKTSPSAIWKTWKRAALPRRCHEHKAVFYHEEDRALNRLPVDHLRDH